MYEKVNECESSRVGPASDSFMLEKAERHIEKQNQELKNTTKELMEAKEKAIYYKTMLIKILDL